jgi:O-antigen/teichoic acid export membrane protein
MPISVSDKSSADVASRPTGADTLHIGGKLLAHNTAVNLVGQIVPLVVGVAAMPYTVRHLGPDRFGILSLAWMTVGYFALFDLGIGPATTKFVAELLSKAEIEKLPSLVWTALVCQTGQGLVASVLLAAAAAPAVADRLLKIPAELHSQAHWVLVILAVSLPFNLAAGSLGGVLAASQRFDLVNAIAVPSTVAIYLAPALGLALGFNLPAIVIILVLTRVAALGISFLLCVRLYPALARFSFDRRLIRSLLGFGGWVTVSGAVGPILIYVDRFLIGSILSIAAVGFYTPPFMISTRLGIVPSSLAATLFPAFSGSAARGDEEWIRSALARSLKFLLLVMGAASLLLISFSRPILALWLGNKYAAEGTLALDILAVGVFTNSLASVPYNLLYGVGRPDLCAKFHVIELPIHVGLGWLLISRFGLPGAALAWTIRVTLDLVLLIVAACWVTHTSPRFLVGRDLRRSGAIVVGLAGSLTTLRLSTDALAPNAAGVLLLAIGFLLAGWVYVLDEEERWKIRVWFRPAL